jgi:putative tricarboxylic transport membrane protein
MVGFFLIYGYTSFFVMDAQLPVFAKLSLVWPSSFPKILSIVGLTLGLGQLLFWHGNASSEIDRGNLKQYEWITVGIMTALMVGYALLLRPLGFVGSTMTFLMLGSYVLGERKYVVMAIVALIATLAIWYLVDPVLGIYLRPWPFFVYGGM